MNIEFMVLACSYKHGGRCVAGIDLTNNMLIRIISRNADSCYALDKSFCVFNGEELQKGIVYNVEIGEKAPNQGAQTENYYVDYPFVKSVSRPGSENELIGYISSNIYPFKSKFQSLKGNYYTRLSYSLCLKLVYNLHFYSSINNDNAPKTKVDFEVIGYDGNPVVLSNFAVTDPAFCIFGDSNFSELFLNKAYILFSIPPSDGNASYIFAAGVLLLKDSSCKTN